MARLSSGLTWRSQDKLTGWLCCGLADTQTPGLIRGFEASFLRLSISRLEFVIVTPGLWGTRGSHFLLTHLTTSKIYRENKKTCMNWNVQKHNKNPEKLTKMDYKRKRRNGFLCCALANVSPKQRQGIISCNYQPLLLMTIRDDDYAFLEISDDDTPVLEYFSVRRSMTQPAHSLQSGPAVDRKHNVIRR